MRIVKGLLMHCGCVVTSERVVKECRAHKKLFDTRLKLIKGVYT
jgi:hypothetical protein